MNLCSLIDFVLVVGILGWDQFPITRELNSYPHFSTFSYTTRLIKVMFPGVRPGYVSCPLLW